MITSVGNKSFWRFCAIASFMMAASISFAANNKTEICHVPSGNPENPKKISVSYKAVDRLLQNGLGVNLTLGETETSQGLCNDGYDNDCTGVADDCERDFRYVFTTSTVQTGNLGGLAGADALCTQLADAAAANPGSPLKGHKGFTAWLSDSTTNAIDRVVFDKEYRLLDGSTVFTAKNPGDIIGEPLVAISVDENNVITSGEIRVWTNTLTNGIRYTTRDCNDWTADLTATENGEYGENTSIIRWTTRFNAICSNNLRLYCFEN